MRGAGDARGGVAVASARPPLPAAVLCLVAALVAVLIAPAPAAAAPDAGLESRFVSLINAERAAAGLPALRVADDLVAVGRRHAARMAAAQDLHHNPNLGADVGGWEKVGENVGRGPDLDRIHAAFMASPGHRANVLDREWTEVGVGVEVVDGGLWVTELFRLPIGASAAPAPAPASPEAPAPPPEAATANAATETPTADEPEAAGPEPGSPPPREVPRVQPQLDRVSVVLARIDAAAEDDAAAVHRVRAAPDGHRPA